MSREPDVVFEFEAGRKTIRATVNLYRGTPYLDIREWYEPEPGKPLLPTKKGISVSRDYLEELQEMVEAFAQALKQPGLTRPMRGQVRPVEPAYARASNGRGVEDRPVGLANARAHGGGTPSKRRTAESVEQR